MKIQKCNKGCGTDITIQLDDGKWKPFVYNSQSGQVVGLHDCPNSTFNKKKNSVEPTYNTPGPQMKQNDDRNDIPQLIKKIEEIQAKQAQHELLLTQINQNVNKNTETLTGMDSLVTSSLKDINEIAKLAAENQVKDIPQQESEEEENKQE